MAADMDIEMDLDINMDLDPIAVGAPAVEASIIDAFEAQAKQPQPLVNTMETSLMLPNDTSDDQSHTAAPCKIHLRGLDNLTTDDIRGFAREYSTTKLEKVEWIDDHSANLVYASSSQAEDALRGMSADESLMISELPSLHAIATKPLPSNNGVCLSARIAVQGDRKTAGARERSRFYLMNPEYDPGDRRRRTGRRHSGTYRDRDEERRGRRDDWPQRRRGRQEDEAGDFDASLYDDDAETLAQRALKSQRRSASPEDHQPESRYRDRRALAGRELFPARGADSKDHRLRYRSHSPSRIDGEGSSTMEAVKDNAAAANRLKAASVKAQLRESNDGRELFPNKSNHRRSSAFDAADATADLFASSMPRVPFLDGAMDIAKPEARSLLSRITDPHGRLSSPSDGFAIRGSADKPTTQKFTIKGAATVKELFPARTGANSGKELLSDRLTGRGGQRRKAEDLFS